jgi:hypothetical protein
MKNPYVDFRMKEWGMDEQPRRIQRSVRRVLGELSTDALLRLKDIRLEIAVLPAEDHSVWAYFPIHHRTTPEKKTRAELQEMLVRLPLPLSARNWDRALLLGKRLAVQAVQPKPQTRILLVFSTASANKDTVKLFEERLRDHLGHVLLYLRSPKANNDCPDAMKEWRRSVAPAKGK